MAANNAVVGILRAMLTADTASFDAGMRKAGDTLKGVGDKTKKVGEEVAKLTPQAERMVKAFSGDKMLYTANNLVTAITKVGGATKLTEAEQTRANRTLVDAITKYTALGQTAPKAMLDLEAATRKVVPSTETMARTLMSASSAGTRMSGSVLALTRAFGGYLSVAALGGAAIRTLQYAETLDKASVALGATSTATQRLENIAVGSNTTLEAMTSAITMMQDRLAGGDASAIAALRRLGLTVEQVFALNPDQQFILIAKAIAEVHSQEQQIQLGKDIFGRGAVEIIGAVRSEVDKLAESVRILGPEQVKQLAQAEDAWDRLWLAAKRYSGLAILNISDLLTNPLGWHGASVGPLAPLVLPDLPRAPNLPTQPAGGALRATESAIKDLEEESRKLQERFEKMRALGDSLFGRDVIARAQDLSAALGSIGNVSLLSSDKQQEVNRIVTEAIAVYARLGQDAPARLIAIAKATTQLLVNTADFHDAYAALPPVIDSARASLNAYILSAQTGTEAMLDHAAATKAAHDELLRLGMVLPAAMVSEDASGEARQISREQLHQRLEEQRQQILDFWKRQAGQLEGATIGRLGTLFVGGVGRDVGDDMRQFATRWKAWADGLKDTFEGALNEMLQHFIRQFLGGLIKGIAGARLGQAIGNALMGTVAGTAIGGGAAVATGAVAGSAASGTAAAAGTAGGGATLAALATNPWTIGAAGGVALGLLIANKGLFRGGEEAMHVNPRRDKFLAQFGGPGTGPDSGFHKLAATLTSITGQSGGGALHASLRMADSVKEWERAQAAIVGALAGAGMKGIKSFQMGGFVPPGAVWPTILHGNAFGEDVIPRTSAAQASPHTVNTLHVNISTIDARGVREFVESRDFLDSVSRVIEHNKGFIATRVRSSLVS